MVIEEVFEQLKKHDRKLTKKKFCNDYLGKSESYFYVMRHLGKEASNNALLRCYVELKTSSYKHCDSSISSLSRLANRELADMLLKLIEKRLVEGL